MNFREFLAAYRLSQRGASERFGIPLRSIENWCTGVRTPPPYLIPLLDTVMSFAPETPPHILPYRWFCDSCGFHFGSDVPHADDRGNIPDVCCPYCGDLDTYPDTPEQAKASVDRLTLAEITEE